MNYPIWHIPFISSSVLIAVISVLHVFVAQFAVGGGLFLYYAEKKALKEQSAVLFEWVERHARFFLLLTMVFGGLSGVGVWLIIALVNPAGTSLLVNDFLYAWASEWMFFLAEIIALLLYVSGFKRYRDGTLSAARHLALAKWYFLFAFLSLFAVNGIVSFMLTPGAWLETQDFWHGIFNPTFFPALAFRTCLCLMLAGFFGLVTATSLNNKQIRHSAVKFCAAWICVPLLLLIASTYWYKIALPPELQDALNRRTNDIRPFVRAFIDTVPLLLFMGLLFFIRLPHRAYKPLVYLSLIFGLITASSFEWVRETLRRPWLISGYMYSNGFTVGDGKLVKEFGILETSAWARLVVSAALEEEAAEIAPALAHDATVGAKTNGTNATVALQVRTSNATTQNATEATSSSLLETVLETAQHTFFTNTQSGKEEDTIFSPMAAHVKSTLPPVSELTGKARLAYGSFIYHQQCAGCHGRRAPMLDIMPLIQDKGVMAITAALSAQSIINPYMPPFFGTDDDKQILAEWLATIALQKN